jgi:hypothetical protein
MRGKDELFRKRISLQLSVLPIQDVLTKPFAGQSIPSFDGVGQI